VKTRNKSLAVPFLFLALSVVLLVSPVTPTARAHSAATASRPVPCRIECLFRFVDCLFGPTPGSCFEGLRQCLRDCKAP
jgi:hypothetical protein